MGKYVNLSRAFAALDGVKSPASTEIQIPFNFIPRPYQMALYDSIANGYLRGVAIWHRRAG
jgi:hypothetical protein